MTSPAPKNSKFQSIDDGATAPKNAAKAQPVAEVENKDPFAGVDPSRVVLLVPSEEFHRERTLEELQKLLGEDADVPPIAHQIRLGRIGDRILFPVTVYSTKLGKRKQPEGWKLKIGAPIACDKLIPIQRYDDEMDTKPDYRAFVAAVQKQIPVTYQVRLSEDKLLKLVSC